MCRHHGAERLRQVYFCNLIPVLDAAENAALPIILDGKNVGVAKARARDGLQKVGLGDRLKSRPDQLSGGQPQRSAVHADRVVHLKDGAIVDKMYLMLARRTSAGDNIQSRVR